MTGPADPAAARREAEEALKAHDVAVAGDEWAFAPISLDVADALRDLLAEPQEPATSGFDPVCPRCQRHLSDHYPDRNNDPVCADFPSNPAPAPDAVVREALLAGRELLAVVRAGRLASIGAAPNVYIPQIGVAWLTPLAAKIEMGAAITREPALPSRSIDLDAAVREAAEAARLDLMSYDEAVTGNEKRHALMRCKNALRDVLRTIDPALDAQRGEKGE